MDAMIFAAGLGTRLRPYTDTTPKALIEVGGRPMLELVARRLVAVGADRIIVNVHHHAGQMNAFLEGLDLGAEIAISDESDHLLETGGGLKKAAPLFRGSEPFLLHNGDIYSEIDLAALYRAHDESRSLATLAVMERDTSRYLLFDGEGSLCGYGNRATGLLRKGREPIGPTVELGFCGIHVISPRIFELITESGPFSIIDLYVRLIAAGHRVAAHRVDGSVWVDIGKPEQLERARSLALESDSAR